MEHVLVTALITAGCARPPACYDAPSGTAGWKRVELPHAAPHLAAPSRIDQFRSDEPALVWGTWGRAPEHPSLGQTRYVLWTGGSSEWGELLQLQFGTLLGGAAVEVVGEKGYGEYPILRRTRTHEDTLWLPLEKGTTSVAVTVHHHLRAAPEVTWRVGARERLEPALPHSLYYLDPGEGAVELCEAPSRPTGVQRIRLDGSAEEVALQPTALTRVLHRRD